MIFRWLDARPAQAFGRDLAHSFVTSVGGPDGKISDRKFEAKAKTALTNLSRKLADFQRERPQNFFQKAKLGNAFKWALKDAGYDAAYVDKLTDLLMLQLQ